MSLTATFLSLIRLQKNLANTSKDSKVQLIYEHNRIQSLEWREKHVHRTNHLETRR